MRKIIFCFVVFYSFSAMADGFDICRDSELRASSPKELVKKIQKLVYESSSENGLQKIKTMRDAHNANSNFRNDKNFHAKISLNDFIYTLKTLNPDWDLSETTESESYTTALHKRIDDKTIGTIGWLNFKLCPDHSWVWQSQELCVFTKQNLKPSGVPKYKKIVDQFFLVETEKRGCTNTLFGVEDLSSMHLSTNVEVRLLTESGNVLPVKHHFGKPPFFIYPLDENQDQIYNALEISTNESVNIGMSWLILGKNLDRKLKDFSWDALSNIQLGPTCNNLGFKPVKYETVSSNKLGLTLYHAYEQEPCDVHEGKKKFSNGIVINGKCFETSGGNIALYDDTGMDPVCGDTGFIPNGFVFEYKGEKWIPYYPDKDLKKALAIKVKYSNKSATKQN